LVKLLLSSEIHYSHRTSESFVTLSQSRSLDRYRGADKFLAQQGRKQVTVTEDFDVHVSYL